MSTAAIITSIQGCPRPCPSNPAPPERAIIKADQKGDGGVRLLGLREVSEVCPLRRSALHSRNAPPLPWHWRRTSERRSLCLCPLQFLVWLLLAL